MKHQSPAVAADWTFHLYVNEDGTSPFTPVALPAVKVGRSKEDAQVADPTWNALLVL